MQTSNAPAQLRVWLLFCLFTICCASSGSAVQLPMAFKDLGSADFRKREDAQGKLLDWAKKSPEPAMLEFLEQSRDASDPEIRERCYEILRILVDAEYMKEGEGYIGVALALTDEILTVPGDLKPRYAIRVIEVRADTPGEAAGVQLNDMIVALEGGVWRNTGASSLFRERVKTMKPNSRAKLSILRNGEVLELKVTLGRRPVMADLFINGQDFDTETAEREAKDVYFKLWLSKRKTKIGTGS